MITKICRRCKEEKPVEEFGINGRTADSRSLYCKECTRAYNRKERPKRIIHLLKDGRSYWGCMGIPKYLEQFFGSDGTNHDYL